MNRRTKKESLELSVRVDSMQTHKQEEAATAISNQGLDPSEELGPWIETI